MPVCHPTTKDTRFYLQTVLISHLLLREKWDRDYSTVDLIRNFELLSYIRVTVENLQKDQMNQMPGRMGPLTTIKGI